MLRLSVIILYLCRTCMCIVSIITCYSIPCCLCNKITYYQNAVVHTFCTLFVCRFLRFNISTLHRVHGPPSSNLLSSKCSKPFTKIPSPLANSMDSFESHFTLNKLIFHQHLYSGHAKFSTCSSATTCTRLFHRLDNKTTMGSLGTLLNLELQ